MFGQQVSQFNPRQLAAPGTERLINLRGTALLAVEAVAGDMRGSQYAQVGQGKVDLRLALPYIQYRLQVDPLKEQLTQGAVIHHRATAGIDQPTARLESCQSPGVEQVPGRVAPRFAQRRMQADDIALLDNGFQADIRATFTSLARGIAHQHVPTQPMQYPHQPTTDFTGAHYPVGTLGQVGAFEFGEGQQTAQHVVDNAAGIATGCAGPLNTRFGEVAQVEVVGTDGAGADKTYAATFKQGSVDLGHRAHQQHIGLLYRRAVDGAAGITADFSETLEKGLEQGDIFVGNNQHGGLLCRPAV
ncbi:hypothetical protein D3C85_955380 [compost metagenome]